MRLLRLCSLAFARNALTGLAILLLAAPNVVRAQTSAPATPWLKAEIRSKIEALFATNAQPDTPGYALAILKDDQFALAKGFGQANLDDSIAITPQTAFHLASLSKQFTGAAVALLILDGKLSLEDPVSKYLPETAKYGQGLQVKHLVYMTSGLHEYSDLPRENGDPWITFHYFTRDEAIRTALKADKLEFTAGTDWAYRNINYMLLTRLVEKVSGQPFSIFMQQRIFLPLGMTHSLIDDDTTVVIPHRATGYAQRSDPRVQKELADHGFPIKPGDGWVRLVRVSPHFGGSGVFTTLDDLCLWDRNWYTQTLGGTGFTELMNKRMRFQHDKDNDAFGLVWREFYGKPALDYSGGDTDTSTYMVRFPGEHLTVICLSNMPLGDAEGKARQVLDLLHSAGNL